MRRNIAGDDEGADADAERAQSLPGGAVFHPILWKRRHPIVPTEQCPSARVQGLQISTGSMLISASFVLYCPSR